jgi:rRNA maturation RNase YbeY
MINIVTSSRYKIDRPHLQKEIQIILDKYELPYEITLNVVFVGKRKMREIANTYKHEDVALPVLSFSYKDQMEHNDNLLGEVILCYPQAVLLAAEKGKRVEVMFVQLIDHGIDNIMTK